MKLSHIMIILKRLRILHEYTELNVSGHRVADELRYSWSRATTYRKLSKCEKLGLIGYADTGNSMEWVITPKGRSFMEDYRELSI